MARETGNRVPITMGLSLVLIRASVQNAIYSRGHYQSLAIAQNLVAQSSDGWYSPSFKSPK